MTEVTEVTQDDVERILAQLRPGSLQPSTEMFRLYVRLMEEDRRPIATRNALGRALTQAGCTRHRVKRRGEEIHSWRVPGSAQAADAEDRERVRQVHQELGPGIHSNALIDETYRRLARERGWRHLLPEVALARLLTQLGYPRMTYKPKGAPGRGAPSRYFDVNPRS